MRSDLVVYSYRPESNIQSSIVEYVKSLLDDLKKNNLNVDSIKVIDGNEQHKSSHSLIHKVLHYWQNRNNGTLYIAQVFQSFLVLEAYLNTGTVNLTKYHSFATETGQQFDDTNQKLIVDSLIECAKKDQALNINNKYEPNFFNAVILLEAGVILESGDVLGIAMGTLIEDYGAICLNADPAKSTIWHETAHMLGAKDHYDLSNQKQTKSCRSRYCFMQFRPYLGNLFCKESYAEMKRMLNILAEG